MNKISSVSSISSAAAREGQGSLRKTDGGGDHHGVDGGPSSQVALTGMALAMVEAQQVAEQTPDVDEQRVAEIRDAIASGSYNIDADRIASVLLTMENDLVVE